MIFLQNSLSDFFKKKYPGCLLLFSTNPLHSRGSIFDDNKFQEIFIIFKIIGNFLY